MALTKPTLNQVPAWDATKGYTFTFNVVGGTQVAGSILTIRNNETNVIVYQHTESSYRFENTIPAGILTNGVNYNAYIVTLDINLNQSVASNVIQFYCYSSPEIDITNIPSGDIIPSSDFPFEATYSQAQGEMLNTYRFTLYNASRIQISTSGTMYATTIQSSYQGDTILTPLEYVFSGLADNTTYYIKIDGLTIDGTEVTTGFVQFVVRYSVPSAFAQLTAVNNCDKGYIRIESNVTLIDGTAFPEPIYINNKEIDVRREGSYVVFDKGYNISNDATIQIWFESPTVDSMLMEMQNNSDEKIQLFTVTDPTNSNRFYCVLVVDNKYIITTNPIEKNHTYCVSIRRIDNLYDLILSVSSGVTGDCLNFTSTEDGTTFSLTSSGSAPNVNISYSFDGTTWNTLQRNTNVSMGQAGSTVYLRGNNNTISNASAYNYFVFSKPVNSGGSVMSLLDNVGNSTVITADFCFQNLFLGSKILTAPKLPATTLSDGCYSNMFVMTLITKAPELPATTLATGCYDHMFAECSNLNEIKIAYTGRFRSNYFSLWTLRVSPSGVLYYNGSDTTVDTSAIPEGWVVNRF